MASSGAIALDETAPAPRLPWVFRVTLASPGAPWLLAGVFALIHLVVGGVLLRSGEAPWGLQLTLILHLIYTFYVAEVPVAAYLLARGAERDLAALTPALGPGARDEVLRVPPRTVRISVLVGLAMALSSLGTASFSEVQPTNVWFWSFLAPREVALNVLVFVVLIWGFAVAMRMARRVGEQAEVSLLDSGASAPVVRSALRVALWWLVTWALSVPLLFIFREDRTLLEFTALIVAVALALSVAAVFLPLAHVRRRVRAEKRDELAEVRRQIVEARAAREDERLPGLLAWEARVEAVRDWPIDAGALRRLGLYLLIPLGSWVGAAFVERGVDAALR